MGNTYLGTLQSIRSKSPYTLFKISVCQVDKKCHVYFGLPNIILQVGIVETGDIPYRYHRQFHKAHVHNAVTILFTEAPLRLSLDKKAFLIYVVIPLGSSINHMVNFLGIFDTFPLSWTRLLIKDML